MKRRVGLCGGCWGSGLGRENPSYNQVVSYDLLSFASHRQVCPSYIFLTRTGSAREIRVCGTRRIRAQGRRDLSRGIVSRFHEDAGWDKRVENEVAASTRVCMHS